MGRLLPSGVARTRRTAGVITVGESQLKPGEQPLGITALGQVKGGVEPFEPLARQFARQGIEKTKPLHIERLKWAA